MIPCVWWVTSPKSSLNLQSCVLKGYLDCPSLKCDKQLGSTSIYVFQKAENHGLAHKRKKKTEEEKKETAFWRSKKSLQDFCRSLTSHREDLDVFISRKFRQSQGPTNLIDIFPVLAWMEGVKMHPSIEKEGITLLWIEKGCSYCYTVAPLGAAGPTVWSFWCHAAIAFKRWGGACGWIMGGFYCFAGQVGGYCRTNPALLSLC